MKSLLHWAESEYNDVGSYEDTVDDAGGAIVEGTVSADEPLSNPISEGTVRSRPGPKTSGPHNKKIREVADSVRDGRVIAGGGGNLKKG